MKAKQIISFIVIGTLLTGLTACNSSNSSGEMPELSSRIDSVSYSLGYSNATALKRQDMEDIDIELMIQGIRDGYKEKEVPISYRQMQMILQQYQADKREAANQRRAKEIVKHRKKAQEFLEKNKEKEGVKETESGLQYKILKEGTGTAPTSEDTVVAHYEGTLLDGEVFDSSYDRGEPAEFPLSRVIAGWTEGLQLMKEGAKYKFWIPADLAYGMSPPPGSPIGAGEMLIFEVELLEVK